MIISVDGVIDTEKILKDIAPKHAINLSRSVNHGIASQIAKQAKKNIKTNGIEDTGNLRKSIKSKRRRSSPDKPISDVVITSGKGAKNDGFYWRFIEHGTKNLGERPFIAPAVELVKSKLVQIYNEQFTKKLSQAVNRELKKSKK